jgi:hypothetical protein
VFLRPQVAEREGEIRREVATRQRVDLALQRVRLASAGDSTASDAVGEALAELDAALLAQGGRGRVVLDLDDRGRWVGTDRDPVLEHGDVFIVPLAPATITVMGSVMNPGTVMMARARSFDDYVRIAGGPTREADLGRSYVLRASGAAVPRASAGRLQPGDAIVVPVRPQTRGGFARAFGGSTRFFIEMAADAALVLAATR